MALALGAPLPLAHAQVINAVVVASCGTPPQTYTAGQFQPLLVDTTGAFCVNSSGGGGTSDVVITPTSAAAAGIAPQVAGSAVSSKVLKASPGNFYGAYAFCTSACWLQIFNSATLPSNGATTSGVAAGNLQDCIPIAAGGYGSINYNPGPPEVFSTGITAAISSTNCATLTASTVGFIHGSVQ